VTDFIAIDWSGRAKRAAEAIWLGRVTDGRLDELDNGRERHEVIDYLIARDGDAIVGLDFAFSFPRWYCEREGWRTGPEVWRAIAERGDDILARCEPPFWGHAATKAQTLGPPLRATDEGGAKSVFQIGGAGAVGTGSLRGMGQLMSLREAGFSIWPFDEPRLPLVLEIYPRRLTGPVNKSRHRCRRAYLENRFAAQNPVLLERAAGSEDAFDAAVSALVMAEHLTGPDSLPAYPRGAPELIEGAVWAPS
jgi:hypothetical protein